MKNLWPKILLKKTSQEGTTSVEFAIVALLLLIIIFGIIEFALLFLQEHLVSNAAREALRVGVRANNYNCFTSAGCNASNPVYRAAAVNTRALEYLDVLYNTGSSTLLICPGNPNRASDRITVAVCREPNNVNAEKKKLIVEVTAPNIFPQLLSGLIPGFDLPETFSYTTEGFYEDEGSREQ